MIIHIDMDIEVLDKFMAEDFKFQLDSMLELNELEWKVNNKQIIEKHD